MASDSSLTSPILSLPEQIARQLQADIVTNRKPGDRLPTVMELAAQFDVSKHSITNALEILARAGIINKRQGRGVFVAERKTSWRVGILSELDLFDVRISHQWRALAGALKARLEELGAQPLFYIGNAIGGPESADVPTCPRFWDDVAAGRLDGAVILDVPSVGAWEQRIENCPIPAVGTKTGFEAQPDNVGIVTVGVKRLAALGCRRLGLLAWHSANVFRRVVNTCGLATRDAWIRTDIDPVVRGAGWDEFHEIWTAAGEKPDGLLILDDMLFLDAQLAMIEMGVRVPEELQLAVLTNRDASPTVRLPINAIEIDPAEQAVALAEMLMKRLQGKRLAPTSKLLSFHEILPQSGATVGAGIS